MQRWQMVEGAEVFPSEVSILWELRIIDGSDFTSSQRGSISIQTIYYLPVLVIVCLLPYTGG